MNRIFFFLLLLAVACTRSPSTDPLVAIQIQDRNGLTETISNPERLTPYESADFFSSQPYKKVLRVYRSEGKKNRSKITTYHPNGMIWQYLEAEEMRAHGAFREWFANGQLRIEAQVVGGTADVAPGVQNDWLFDGLSEVWDDQGNLLAQISYDKGVLEGTSLYFFPHGQIEREVPFVKNAIEGVVSEFSPQGQLIAKIQYKKGVKEGESLIFFEKGQVARNEEYKEGLLLKGTYYTPTGELIAEVDKGGGYQAAYENNCLTLIEYRMGKPDGAVKKFSPTGELHKMHSVKNGRKHGEEIEYYLPAELEIPFDPHRPIPKLSLTWNDNTIHGLVKTWYPNGSRQSEREYCRNKKQGPSLAWYRDGSLMLMEEYEGDRLVKGEYFKRSGKEPVSSVVNGNGVAFLYDESGIFLKKISYSKGKPLDLEE